MKGIDERTRHYFELPRDDRSFKIYGIGRRTLSQCIRNAEKHFYRRDAQYFRPNSSSEKMVGSKCCPFRLKFSGAKWRIINFQNWTS